MSVKTVLDSFEPGISAAVLTVRSAEFEGSLHGLNEFATASVTQIFDMGTSDTVKSNDMNPIVIISTHSSPTN